jgi:succinate dehydrogenase / fumarate reductase cytochrome b subunit
MSKSGFLTSSIGKKFIMGITGLFLISFLIVHCFVNALIFVNDGGETFNLGCEFMGTNWIIRAMEIVLFAGLILHMVQALILTIENRKARPVPYAKFDGAANSKWYSRSMGLLGTLLLMFLIVHLAHFWVQSRFTDNLAHTEDQIEGDQITMFERMKFIFAYLPVVIIYCLGMISLAYHLLHGFASAFQSLGLNHVKYNSTINFLGTAFSIIVPLIFAAMPISIYMGWIQ